MTSASKRVGAMLSAAFLLTVGGAAAAQAPTAPKAYVAPAPSCDRACLKGMLDLYLDALGKRDPKLLPTTQLAKFTENGFVVYPGEGLWQTAKPGVSGYLYTLDPESQQAAVQAIVPEDGREALIQLRLKIDDKKISESEIVVVRKGGASLFNPDTLRKPLALWHEKVPVAQRNNRSELIWAANAYFDAVETEATPTYMPAPFAKGANRIENGIQTTNVPLGGGAPSTADEQLDRGMFAGTMVTDRRYPVVDVETGVVLSLVMYRRPPPGPNDSPSQIRQATRGQLLLAETFKVSGGKIQEIRAVMVERPRTAVTGW